MIANASNLFSLGWLLEIFWTVLQPKSWLPTKYVLIRFMKNIIFISFHYISRWRRSHVKKTKLFPKSSSCAVRPDLWNILYTPVNNANIFFFPCFIVLSCIVFGAQLNQWPASIYTLYVKTPRASYSFGVVFEVDY